jgi:hypothetical protein
MKPGLSDTSVVKLMECMFIILEAGCTIKRLEYTTKRELKLVFCCGGNDGNSSWTMSIKTCANRLSVDVDDMYSQLESLNIISSTDWQRHKTNFQRAENGSLCKNIAIMKFILNAMRSGWRVRKSLARSEYKFNKNHNSDYNYLSGNFLSRFLEHNIIS